MNHGAAASPAELVTADWRLRADIYRDPAVFEREMETIFRTCWIFVAHESEIPEPGDYKRAVIGRQPVIVTRDADDAESIHVMFNRCRHRGSAVCQRVKGNANAFRCSYHGWTYGSDGHLIGVPFDDAYDALDKSQMGLVHVPRVASYRGFVFANLDPDAMSLEDYLGTAGPYLDYVADLDPAGITFSAGVQQYKFEANWKFQVENTIDIYHVAFTHKSWLDILSEKAGKRVPFVRNMANNRDWRTLAFDNGHAAHEYRSIVPPAVEDQAAEDAGGGHDVGIGELLPFNLVIFPNLAFVGAQLRLITPVAVDRTRVELYPIVLPSDEGSTFKALRDHEAFYGPAGFGSADDMEVAFDRVVEGLSATASPQDWVLIARGSQREEVGEDGVRIGRSTDELPQRSFYGRWRDLIDRVSDSGAVR